MIGDIWNSILITPLLNVLILFYRMVGNNMGLAIIAVSLVVKALSIPFTNSSLKAMQRQREMLPEIEKLKKKYGHDQKKLAEEQMKLYKDAGINPASGCLSQIFPILVIIALFSVISLIFNPQENTSQSLNAKLYSEVLKFAPGTNVNSSFFYLDLAKPDPFYILPILSAVLTFVVSKMMLPAVEKAEKLAKKTDDVKDDVMYNMQEQMLYITPVMSLIVGLRLPSGVVLNILVTTLFSIVQQYLVSGPGSFGTLFKKAK